MLLMNDDDDVDENDAMLRVEYPRDINFIFAFFNQPKFN